MVLKQRIDSRQALHLPQEPTGPKLGKFIINAAKVVSEHEADKTSASPETTELALKYHEIALEEGLSPKACIVHPRTRALVESERWTIGMGATMVPGCMHALETLIESHQLNPEHIRATIGDRSNWQETQTDGILIRDKKGMTLPLREISSAKLASVAIEIGSDTSMAHHWSALAREDTHNPDSHSYALTVGNSSFVGINVRIGSDGKIGDHVTIWWNTRMGHDVSIGNYTLVGARVVIEDGTTLPSCSFVPHNITIQKQFEVLDFK